MQVYKKTDIGLRRTSNQDFCDGGLFPDGSAWVVVCDGMGGANAGNVASELAVQTICDALAETYDPKKHGREIESLLTKAVQTANKTVYETAQKDDSLQGMGTTVVAAIIKDEKVHVVHIGDSRAYMIHDTFAEQITVDHSMVQELILMGQITAEEAKVHPQRNIITRALGIHEQVESEYTCVPFRKNAKLLICTDGLSNYMDEVKLFEISQKYAANELANQLVQMAIDAGGSDNITVVYVDQANM